MPTRRLLAVLLSSVALASAFQLVACTGRVITTGSAADAASGSDSSSSTNHDSGSLPIDSCAFPGTYDVTFTSVTATGTTDPQSCISVGAVRELTLTASGGGAIITDVDAGMPCALSASGCDLTGDCTFGSRPVVYDDSYSLTFASDGTFAGTITEDTDSTGGIYGCSYGVQGKLHP